VAPATFPNGPRRVSVGGPERTHGSAALPSDLVEELMTSPKRSVLEAVGHASFPLTKSALLDLLELAAIDQDIIVSVSALDDAEFRDLVALERKLDIAFGMPDAFPAESVLESESAHAAEPKAMSAGAGGPDAAETWVGGGRDLTVGELRAILTPLDDDVIVMIELLDDANAGEPMVPIGIRIDDRTAIVLEANWLNSG
jgi:hypothetical protein